MLTRQEAIAEYDFSNGRIYPDRLTRGKHAHFVPAIERLLELYRNGSGATRQQLHQRAEAILETVPDCSSRRMAAFIKLLDDVSVYENDRGKKAAKLRQTVFRIAARFHPLVNSTDQVFGSDQTKIKQQIAADLKMSWSQIERKLYADVMEFHPLKSFDGYSGNEGADELLARYNVAQVQAALYRALRLTIWTKADLKTIVRAIKLSRLMHTINRNDEGEYQFIVDGPASAVRTTRRYGIAMARLIPVLLGCRDWRLQAPIEIGVGKHRLSLQLTSNDGLRSNKTVAADFDSEVELNLFEKWNKSPLENWTLKRESEILHVGQKVFTPDFVAQDTNGRQIFIEIVGYWTPEYLQAKVETLRQFADRPLMIIAQEDKRQRLESLGLPPSHQILSYKTKIRLQDFQRILENWSDL